jgi:signal transduction histidine kinase
VTDRFVLQGVTTGTPQPLLAELEGTLQRVAQEALSNVSRHARARRVGLTLSYMEDVMVLDVRDDGAGFDGEGGREGQGHGLPGMERRPRRVGGRLTVESAPGRGAALSAGVPAIAAGGGRGAL